MRKGGERLQEGPKGILSTAAGPCPHQRDPVHTSGIPRELEVWWAERILQVDRHKEKHTLERQG